MTGDIPDGRDPESVSVLIVEDERELADMYGIEERGLDCRVALVTAVNPDFDLIDLCIDDYVLKPVTREKLRKTVARLVTLREYNEQMQSLTAKRLRRNVLEVEKTRASLQESDEFQRLETEIEELAETVGELADDLDLEDE